MVDRHTIGLVMSVIDEEGNENNNSELQPSEPDFSELTVTPLGG